MYIRKSKIDWLKRFIERHGNKYNYSEINFDTIGAHSRVLIKCNQCSHKWVCYVFNHYGGNGCKKCQYKRLPQNQPISHERFLEKAKAKHGNDKFEYLSKYETKRKKIKIKCKICQNVFLQRADSHLEGAGCKKCSEKLSKYSQMEKPEIFEEKCRKVHNNKYSYIGDYDGYKNKLTILCPKHGKFRQEANAHLRGNGCPRCKGSKSETKIARWLIENNIRFESQKSFQDLKNIHLLRFDFFIPDKNLLIEFDGIYHYYPMEWGDKHNLEKIQFRDKIKNEYCAKNNIKLLRIPFWEDKNINKILEDYFKNDARL